MSTFPVGGVAREERSHLNPASAAQLAAKEVDKLSPDQAASGSETSRQTGGPVAGLPWVLIIAVLISYTALFLFTQGASDTSPTSFVLLGLALALVATRFIRFRIAHTSWAPWVLRIVGLGFVGSNFPHSDSGHPMLFDPGAVALFGMIWAIEATIQAWRVKPWGNPAGGSLILLSTLVFTAAATIGEDVASGGNIGNYVIYLTPAFLTFILLSFRALERRETIALPRSVAGVLRIDPQPVGLERRVTFLRACGIAGALLVGFLCWMPVHLYRSQINTWGNDVLQNHSVPEPTGLSTAPALGDMLNGDGSPTRVLRIDNYQGDPHMRGLSFETYTRGRWLPAEDSLHFRPVTSADLHSAARGPVARVHCYVEGLKEIVAPLNVAGIVPGADISVDRADDAGPVLRVNAVAAPYTYDLIQGTTDTSLGILRTPIDAASRAGAPSLPRDAAERAKCLDVPVDIDPKVRDLANKIWHDAGAPSTPEAKMDAVADYLMSHYTYSLTTHPGAGDRISHFLLSEKSAHCEYFASAGVMLLRILGVPSRYVTGYYAHESEGGSTIVRQRDSHAWTECWVDGTGWMTIDMTPGGGRPDKLYPPTSAMTRIWEWLADRITDAREYVARFTPVELSLGVAGIAGAFYGLRWLISRRRRRRPALVSPPTYDTRDEALRDMARLFEAFLATHGVPCPANTPWVEHLDALRIPQAPGDTLAGPRRPDNVNGIAVVDGRAKIDVIHALEFVRNYNTLRFRKSFDAEHAAGTRAILDQLIGEAN